MIRMRRICGLGLLVVLTSTVFGQVSPGTAVFEAASVKASPRLVGPDYNNRIVVTPTGISARNATLQRLIAEAYHLQLNQVLGPNWLKENEYDVEARAGAKAAREQVALMLRSLLVERFQLKQHQEARDMRVYELTTDSAGPKIHRVQEGEAAKDASGFHFHGELRDFVDVLAVQLTIPAANDPSQPARAGGPPVVVLDKTGLPGIYDFSVDIRPEPGSDMSTQWQRALGEQLGLRIVGRKDKVNVVVVDSAEKAPTAN
jgi:uncharacterized protein (TIGR03435 family)